MVKTKDLKKWPQDWVNHIIQSCQLYFDNKPINFNNYYETFVTTILASYPDGIYTSPLKLNLEFEHKGRLYIIDILPNNPNFSLYFYCKDYYVDIAKPPFYLSSITSISSGYDHLGAWYLTMIGGQSGFEKTPYEIIKTIENIILNHNDNGEDNGGGDNDEEPSPDEPDEPVEQLDLEPLLNC